MSRFCSEVSKDFHKGEAYLIKENFVGKKLSLKNNFVTKPIFRHFSPIKVFF